MIMMTAVPATTTLLRFCRENVDFNWVYSGRLCRWRLFDVSAADGKVLYCREVRKPGIFSQLLAKENVKLLGTTGCSNNTLHVAATLKKSASFFPLSLGGGSHGRREKRIPERSDKYHYGTTSELHVPATTEP